MIPDIESIAAGLSEADRKLLLHDLFKDRKGWEPKWAFTPQICRFVELGLLVRADGRRIFEKIKDAFVVPTELGLQLRTYLESRTRGEGE